MEFGEAVKFSEVETEGISDVDSTVVSPFVDKSVTIVDSLEEDICSVDRDVNPSFVADSVPEEMVSLVAAGNSVDVID